MVGKGSEGEDVWQIFSRRLASTDIFRVFRHPSDRRHGEHILQQSYYAVIVRRRLLNSLRYGWAKSVCLVGCNEDSASMQKSLLLNTTRWNGAGRALRGSWCRRWRDFKRTHSAWKNSTREPPPGSSAVLQPERVPDSNESV